MKKSTMTPSLRQRAQAAFKARGLASRDEARKTGCYFSAASVHAELRAMLKGAAKRMGR
jgi:hypothetical protein